MKVPLLKVSIKTRQLVSSGCTELMEVKYDLGILKSIFSRVQRDVTDKHCDGALVGSEELIRILITFSSCEASIE